MMATLRAPDGSQDGPTRPPAHLVGPVVESFVEPWEATSLAEAARLAEARHQTELDAYHAENAHRVHEIVVPICDSEGFEGEVATTTNPAYSGLTVTESRALLLGLAPVFHDSAAFDEAMDRGAT